MSNNDRSQSADVDSINEIVVALNGKSSIGMDLDNSIRTVGSC